MTMNTTTRTTLPDVARRAADDDAAEFDTPVPLDAEPDADAPDRRKATRRRRRRRGGRHRKAMEVQR